MPRNLGKPTVRKLHKLQRKRDVDALVEALEHEEIWVRRMAATALGELRDPRALDPLIRALGDPNPNVRRDVAEALGELADPAAVGPLAESLVSADEEVAPAVVRALQRIGGTEVEEAFEHAGLAALARWSEAESGDCEIGHRFSRAASIEVGRAEFQALVDRGYDPFTRGRVTPFSLAALKGFNEMTGGLVGAEIALGEKGLGHYLEDLSYRALQQDTGMAEVLLKGRSDRLKQIGSARVRQEDLSAVADEAAQAWRAVVGDIESEWALCMACAIDLSRFEAAPGRASGK